jgi:hypothetical protein
VVFFFFDGCLDFPLLRMGSSPCLLVVLVDFDIFWPYSGDSVCDFFDFVLDGRMAILAMRLERHLGGFPLVDPFIEWFHPALFYSAVLL